MRKVVFTGHDIGGGCFERAADAGFPVRILFMQICLGFENQLR
jgi:hypothetical protein